MNTEREQNDPARQGISNRESPGEEAQERNEFPPVQEGQPPPEDASGRTGPDADDVRDGQTSHKAGSHSIAEKESNTRYPDRSMPSTRKVAGAFGREPSSRERQDESR